MRSKAATAFTEPGACAERCSCGSLLARRTARGIEIKCRRCKRIMILPLDAVRARPRGHV